nr:GNAT family N-acetyltransferase [Bacteriovorax sp. HI3]
MKKITLLSKFPMKDWAQMDQFIAVTHGQGHILRYRPIFEWFFVRGEDREHANMLVAYEEDRLVSLLGYLPTTFNWNGENVQGAWTAFWMTIEEYRNGVGVLLMRKLTELFPIVATQGASAMNQAIVSKMRFQFLEKIPKSVCVFNREKIKNELGYDSSKDFNLSDNGSDIAEVDFSSMKDYSPDWNFYPALKFGTLRTYNYINQRYATYPFFKYKIFVTGPKTAPAVCVARVVDTDRGIKVARILDFFFPETDEGKKLGMDLMKKCLNSFQKAGCDYADFYCTADEYHKMLEETGFERDYNDSLPSLLDPIDMSRKVQNAEIYVSAALKAKSPEGIDHFFISRGDGDQDRANKSYLVKMGINL